MSGCLSTIARRRKAALRALTLAALAAGLAGCYVPRDTVGNIPTDYRKRHPIAIREAEKTVHVFIGNNRGALMPEQRIDVMAFANVWRGEATGGVIIDVPVGTPNELASAQAAREIRSLLAAGGIPPHGVTMRPYQPKDPGKLASVRISYSKLVAEAGPCGLWPHDIGPSLDPSYNENRPYWNLGCANQRNLAAMVANPADLVQPRGEANVYTQRRTYVGEQYRRGANSSTNYSNPTKGYLSDVGK
jgi:pilus assembly protein CpaD